MELVLKQKTSQNQVDQNQNYDEALKSFDQAIELNPKNVLARSNKGFVLNYLERLEEAAICYDKVIELAPDSYLSWNAKGANLMHMEKYLEAIQYFDRAIELNSEDADKASCEISVERIDDALIHFETAVKLGGEHYVRSAREDEVF